MHKILISWIAYNNDFSGSDVNTEGPNYQFHKYFFKDYSKHVLLYSAKDQDVRSGRLRTKLNEDFPGHVVEEKLLELDDVINLDEVKSKVEKFLLGHPDDELDLFFSPGTSIMQLSWYICHLTLGLKTRILQTRPPSKSKSGRPELIEIIPAESPMPVSAVIRQRSLGDDKEEVTSERYNLTSALRPVYDKAYKIAKADVTTIIYGATGTGKEHLAGYIRENSTRSQKPFLPVNCSAFGDQLLESRLFGYKKGSFTSADKDTMGIFEEANHGTVFLDEIGDISPYMQQSLLRFLQVKEIQPIGGKPLKVDVRIIAATNKNLLEMCKEGKYRWDLYYRLNVAELELPSLIERGVEDLEEMIKYFLEEKRKEYKRQKPLKLSKEVSQFLRNYHFPGNVRELEQIITSFYVYCDDEVTLCNLPSRMLNNTEAGSLLWKDIEKGHIEKVLELKKGNKRQSYLALGYGSINTLMKKIKEYNIDYQ
ncbi:MAG: sigma 54-interacting transcriptional regulator [Bacteroidales bacterium]|nr:sigma 54-interacting transcriptional regulator [Bacteroidales bacterium]